MAICKKHGNYTPEILEIFGMKIETKCPVCEKEEADQEERLSEMERELKKREALIKRGIEPEYFGATLNDYRPENESEREALTAAHELRLGTIKKVLLLGSNGTGKTMLGSALALSLGGVRFTMYELSARIRAGYNSGESEIEIMDELLSYPLIVIDEIGRTKGSEAELNWLSYLIDKAHTRGIRLLLISNRHQAKTLPEARRGESIEFYLPNDAISRLRQNSKIVEIEGRDRRAST